MDAMNESYHKRMMDVVAELQSQGVRPYRAAPPLFRLLWRCGVHIPPPYYLSFAQGAAVSGIFYGLVMWIFAQLALVADYEFSALPVSNSARFAYMWRFLTIECIIGGLAFGVCMGLYFRWKAKKLRLPPIDG